MAKRLHRSRTDKKIAGVCGGLGRYFEVDPLWFRVAFLAGTIISAGLGLILYMAMVVLVPKDEDASSSSVSKEVLPHRLSRSRKDRMLFGVNSGLGEYFDVDPTWVRLAFVVATIFTAGLGLLVYIAFAVLTPYGEGARAESEEAGNQERSGTLKERGQEPAREAASLSGGEEGDAEEGQRAVRKRILVATTLIATGVVFLLGNLNLFWWWRWSRMWPIVLIVIGGLILLDQFKRRS